MKWQQVGNAFVGGLLRSPLHRMLDSSTLLITITGRISGRTYRFPVNYVLDNWDVLIMRRRDRTWWRNLRGGAPATIRLNGQDFRATAEVIEDTDRSRNLLLTMLRLAPSFQRGTGVRLGVSGDPEDPGKFEELVSDRVVVRLPGPSRDGS